MHRLGWLLWLACACNELYGLDETKVRPAPADSDGDGAPDLRDVCPGVADPAQEDRDGDGFGDACDLCPGEATALNHDEDGDARGDECDLCPAFPDFQRDADNDGVGDSCDDDFARPNRWLLFDPFVDLGPPWTVVRGTWSALADAVTSEAGARLRAGEVAIDGTKPYALTIGITVREPPDGADEFGVELVDEAGGVLVSCLVTCVAQVNDCRFERKPNANTVPPNPFTVVPVNELVLRRNDFSLVCVYAGEVADDEVASAPPSFPRVFVQLVGSPKIQFRHVGIRQ